MLLYIYKIIILLIFTISGMTSGTLIFNSYRKNETKREKILKIILMIYFAMNMMLGIYLLLREEKIIPVTVKDYPILILYIQILQLLNFNFLYIVTNKKQKLFISPIHYVFPGAMFIVIVFFFYILYNKTISSEEVNLYMRPFTAASSLLYLVFYTFISCKYIFSYQKAILQKDFTESTKKKMHWLFTIAYIKIILIVIILTLIIIPPGIGEYFYFSTFLLTSLMFYVSVYNVLKKNYQFLIPASKNVVLTPTGHIIHESISDTDQHNIQNVSIINKKSFEAYFEKDKPYLNPDLKITDIASAFNTNRSYVSKFINEVYGITFNQYINNWRINEAKMLSSLEENQSKSIEEISGMAGFGSVRSYWRAMKNTI